MPSSRATTRRRSRGLFIREVIRQADGRVTRKASAGGVANPHLDEEFVEDSVHLSMQRRCLVHALPRR